jgi:hypothetical protein
MLCATRVCGRVNGAAGCGRDPAADIGKEPVALLVAERKHLQVRDAGRPRASVLQVGGRPLSRGHDTHGHDVVSTQLSVEADKCSEQLRNTAWLVLLPCGRRPLKGLGLIKDPYRHELLALQPGLVLHKPEVESRESYKCQTLIAREELCANGNREVPCRVLSGVYWQTPSRCGRVLSH